MALNPETRESLILRLPTLTDAAAWQEFVRIYEPLVLRFARRRGLQDADAREVVQNVLISVAKAVGDWKPDRKKGRFRAWLFRIARNQLIHLMSKKRCDRGSGESAEMQFLNEWPSPENSTAALETDYRRELFRTAAAAVRDSFQPSTWEAFWKSSVLQLPVEEVARSLNLSVGAVYVARSRVLHRLKLQIRQWENEDAD